MFWSPVSDETDDEDFTNQDGGDERVRKKIDRARS